MIQYTTVCLEEGGGGGSSDNFFVWPVIKRKLFLVLSSSSSNAIALVTFLINKPKIVKYSYTTGKNVRINVQIDINN